MGQDWRAEAHASPTQEGTRMRVGMAAVFQNPGRAKSDFDVYRDDLRLADLCDRAAE